MLMSSMAVMSSYAQSGRKGTASVIEKTPIEVVDGKFTPEIMLRLGRVSDPQLSPDGSRILYGVTYTSIEENRSVRQLYVMNAADHPFLVECQQCPLVRRRLRYPLPSGRPDMVDER